MSYSPSSHHDNDDSLSAYQAFDLDSTYRDRHEFGHPPKMATQDSTSEYLVNEDEGAEAHGEPASAPRVQNGATASFALDPAAKLEPRQAWRAVIGELELSLDPGVFHSFVRDSWVIAYEDGEFIIGIPNAYAKDWVADRLNTLIKRKLRVHMKRSSVQTTFRVQAPEVGGNDDDFESTPLYQAARGPLPASSGGVSFDRQPIQREAGTRPGPDARHTPAQKPESVRNDLGDERGEQRASVPMALRSRYASYLKTEYNFDTFVVGNHNRLAHAAGTAVAQHPGTRFNPFFIYGGVGLGKTHLLHAIGNQAQAQGDVVLYCSSEQFTNELIRAIGNRTTDAFREKYRQVDVLLIDDIQFLCGKERTQEEFFHTFNHLHAAGGQVVLTSDRQPKALGDLEERLRSRFEGGLQADIQSPDFETRVAILQQKARWLNISIEQEALMFVAERVDSNIRELEGALNHLHLQSQMLNSPLSYSLAVQVMNNLAPQRKPCHPAGVVRIVALHYGLTPEDLIGNKRNQPVAHARQVAMYLLREENNLSFTQIGRELGDRDHSTVRYGVNRVAASVEKDNAKAEALRTDLANLRDHIYMPYIH